MVVHEVGAMNGSLTSALGRAMPLSTTPTYAIPSVSNDADSVLVSLQMSPA